MLTYEFILIGAIAGGLYALYLIHFTLGTLFVVKMIKKNEEKMNK